MPWTGDLKRPFVFRVKLPPAHLSTHTMEASHCSFFAECQAENAECLIGNRTRVDHFSSRRSTHSTTDRYYALEAISPGIFI